MEVALGQAAQNPVQAPPQAGGNQPVAVPVRGLVEKLSMKVYSSPEGSPEAADKLRTFEADMRGLQATEALNRSLNALYTFAGDMKVNGKTFRELAERADVRIEIADNIDAAWAHYNPDRPRTPIPGATRNLHGFVQPASEKTGGSTVIILNRDLFDPDKAYSGIIGGEYPFAKLIGVVSHELTHVGQPHNAPPGTPRGALSEPHAELEAYQTELRAVHTVFEALRRDGTTAYYKKTGVAPGTERDFQMRDEKGVFVAIEKRMATEIKAWQKKVDAAGPAPAAPAPATGAITIGAGNSRITVAADSPHYATIKAGLDRGYKVTTVSGQGDVVFNISDPATSTARDVILSQKHRRPEDFAHVLALQMEAQTAQTELFALLKKEGISYEFKEHEPGSPTYRVTLRNAAGTVRNYDVQPRETDRDVSHAPVQETRVYQGFEIQLLQKVKEFSSGRAADPEPAPDRPAERAPQAGTAQDLDSLLRKQLAELGNAQHAAFRTLLGDRGEVQISENHARTAAAYKDIFAAVRKSLGLPETTKLTINVTEDAREMIVSVQDAATKSRLVQFGLLHELRAGTGHTAETLRDTQYVAFPDALESRKSSLIKEGSKIPSGMLDARGFSAFE